MASELKLRLPEILAERVKAIEYIVPDSHMSSVPIEDSIVSGNDSKKIFASRFGNRDTINESTKDGYNNSKGSTTRPG